MAAIPSSECRTASPQGDTQAFRAGPDFARPEVAQGYQHNADSSLFDEHQLCPQARSSTQPAILFLEVVGHDYYEGVVPEDVGGNDPEGVVAEVEEEQHYDGVVAEEDYHIDVQQDYVLVAEKDLDGVAKIRFDPK